jgi:phage shock protein C
MVKQRLTRDMENRMLGGVCAGFARRYGWDVTVVRIAWLLLAIVSAGLGLVLYLATWIVMPRPDQVPPPAPEPPSAGGEQQDGIAGEVDEAAWRLSEQVRGIEGEVRVAGERIAESARVIARHARDSAEEIAEIARGRFDASATQDTNARDASDAGAAHTGQPSTSVAGTEPEPTEPPSEEQREEQRPPPFGGGPAA